ncbi:unnamed protein product [Heligmosomoides polygyrus]|uniref:Methyltranfer_dom domain-containing protein n=1 Tax=Heligmosomoides polygyrus TaxID=6339 RepID=A0A183FVB8_HELPZ|nr:unnamed protein product [Heligmosomoides polygyrus]
MPAQELTLKQAREQFEALISRLKKREEFVDWIHATYCEGEDCAKPMFVADAISKLREIADHIKMKVPDGTVQSETIKWPVSGHDADCGEKNTVHVDCFLYDDYALEAMMKAGKLKRRYCGDCGSRNVVDLNFISHSLAHCQLEFIFTQLVPLKSQPEGFHVLDIGSRLGAVIYAASLYSCGKATVTGVELNQDFVKLQEEVIRDYSLQNVKVVCADIRAESDLVNQADLINVKVVCADIRAESDLVNQADLIVMNNVFSFFLEPEEQVQNTRGVCRAIHFSLPESRARLNL